MDVIGSGRSAYVCAQRVPAVAAAVFGDVEGQWDARRSSKALRRWQLVHGSLCQMRRCGPDVDGGRTGGRGGPGGIAVRENGGARNGEAFTVCGDERNVLYPRDGSDLEGSLGRSRWQGVGCGTVCCQYLAATVHWIDYNWTLRSSLLDYVRFMTPHNGENIAAIVAEILRDWKLTNKIQCITTENASDVVKGMRLLKCKLLRENGVVMSETFPVRCIAHIIHLAVKDAMKDIHKEISSIRKLISAVKASVKSSIRKLISAVKASVKRRDAFADFKNSLKYYNLLDGFLHLI